MYSDLARVIVVQLLNRTFSRFLQIILLLGFSLLPGISQAVDFSALKPYGGLEYVHRSLAFQEGYGKGNFSKSIPQGNAFLGIQINEYLGLEAGYLFSQAVTRTSFSTGSSRTLGIVLLPGAYMISENKINLTGPRLNIVGRLSLGMSGFSAVGSVGVSWLNLKAKTKTLGTDFYPIYGPREIESSIANFSSKKIVHNFMGGMEYKFSNFMRMRILVGYERTSQFKNIAPIEPNDKRISLKNNTLCSVGLTAHF